MLRTMRYCLFLLFLFITSGYSFSQKIAAPDEIYGEFFRDVQQSRIFPDSKTFVDCIPKRDPKEIVSDYLAIKRNPAIRFSMQLFVEANFEIPDTLHTSFSTKEKSIETHINNLWKVLKKQPDLIDTCRPGQWWCHGSLLRLAEPYIVPGGRFREIYYWDSYFTMLGLRESKEFDLIENMINNFAYLVHTYGHVPNGNRTYYLSRSQPPFFSLMLDLLSEIKGNEVYVLYLPALEKEYNYWMDKTAKTQHLVKMPDSSSLNRYWDQLSTPRPEAYIEDREIANQRKWFPQQEKKLYKDLRSAAESGWDFSSRWLKGQSLTTIQTTDLVPVDLNCLLHHLELALAKGYDLSGNKLKAKQHTQLADKRKAAINKYCWSVANGWYVDYNIASKKQSSSLTLAGMFPFFFQISDASKFSKAKQVLEKRFLRSGGLTTTLINTGQQWDAPNGWAPLQWISIIGLENYGEKTLSKIIATRWCALNKRVFDDTGKLMEKYDVVDANKAGGGGEYPSQDGFGWTNGVFLALINKYKL
jgi:alpha,alpha-trehalase